MSDNKKYYLKMKYDFLDSDVFVYLESMKNGYKYSDILLKLYLTSLKSDFILTDDIDILSNITRHSQDDLKKAIEIFYKLKLIDRLPNKKIYIKNIESFRCR